MAFDASRTVPRAASAASASGGGGFGSLPARAASSRALPPPAASSSAAPPSYQGNAGTSWASASARVEDELRRASAQVGVLRKCSDALGTPRDSEDLRGKLGAAMARAREGLQAVGAMLKGELAAAAASDEGSLSQKERGERRLKQQRFGKDAELALGQYKEVRLAVGGGGAVKASAPRAARAPYALSHTHTHTHAYTRARTHTPSHHQAASAAEERLRKFPPPAPAAAAGGAKKSNKGAAGKGPSKAEEGAKCVCCPPPRPRACGARHFPPLSPLPLFISTLAPPTLQPPHAAGGL